MIDTNKPILDATCGSRMMWFDHNNPNAVYVDCREVSDKLIWASKDGKDKRFLTIQPDVIADFTNLPFPDETFHLAVFDPPPCTESGGKCMACTEVRQAA